MVHKWKRHGLAVCACWCALELMNVDAARHSFFFELGSHRPVLVVCGRFSLVSHRAMCWSNVWLVVVAGTPAVGSTMLPSPAAAMFVPSGWESCADISEVIRRLGCHSDAFWSEALRFVLSVSDFSLQLSLRFGDNACLRPRCGCEVAMLGHMLGGNTRGGEPLER